MASKFLLLSKDAIVRGGLEKMIKERLPRSGMIHNVLHLFLNDRFSNHVQTRFFAYKGVTDDPFNAFIVAMQRRSFFADVAICTSDPMGKLLTNDMSSCFYDLIDWKARLAFKTTFHNELLKDWCSSNGKMTLDELNHAFHMDINEARVLHPKPVENYKLGLLKPHHGIMISKIWPYSVHPGTGGNMIDSIESAGGVGVYDQTDYLRSWIILSTNGQMFSFHVDSKHRNRGLGEWVLGAAAKTFAIRGFYPNALVVSENSVSQRLFERVGFKKSSHMIGEIRYEPKTRKSQD